MTVLATAGSMPTRRDLGFLDVPDGSRRGFCAKYNAPFVVFDIVCDEGDTEGVLGNILDRLYVTALVPHAHGVCASLSCLYELKSARILPRVRRGPTMIMPLIVW